MPAEFFDPIRNRHELVKWISERNPDIAIADIEFLLGIAPPMEPEELCLPD